MTPEEAINIIEKMDIPHFSEAEIDEAKEIAIDALKKQIPMKLRFTASTKRCPVCGKQITSIGASHPEYRFCKWCGQAIDWSE